MGRRALLAVLGLLGVMTSCGSRTPLLLPGQGSGGSGSGGSGAGGPTPQAVACHAALQDGAPTPTRGYCTTRANQAALRGPRAPAIAWSVAPFPIVSPEDYLPAETVVDATGRAYVAIDASPEAAVGTQSQLFAVNADGSVAWTTALASSVAQLALGGDGSLWFVEQGNATSGCMGPPCFAALAAFSPDGTNLEIPAALIGSFSLMAIASDGTFFVGSPGLARIAADGTVLWQNSYSQFGASIVVGPEDDVVSDTYVYDAAGIQIGSGPYDDVVAVNAQGNVVGLLVGDGVPPVLTISDPTGSPLSTVPLPSPQFNIDAYQLAVAGDGTVLVLLADEATAPGLTKSQLQIIAVDASGKTRWTTPLDVTLVYDPADLTTHYGLFVDGGGTVVVTAGTVMGLDLASGSVRWTLPPAKPHSCLRPAVLGAGGSILATQCDGTVFLARDP